MSGKNPSWHEPCKCLTGLRMVQAISFPSWHVANAHGQLCMSLFMQSCMASHVHVVHIRSVLVYMEPFILNALLAMSRAGLLYELRPGRCCAWLQMRRVLIERVICGYSRLTLRFHEPRSERKRAETLLYTLMTYLRHVSLVIIIKSGGCMWARSKTIYS